MKSAEVTSPEPFAFSGSLGVCTIHAPSSVTTSISTVSAGWSARCTLVTSTVRGPIFRPSSAEVSSSSSVCGSVPVR